MKEDQAPSGGDMVPSANRGLTRTSALVRRGLDDLLTEQSRINSSSVLTKPEEALASAIPEQALSPSRYNPWTHLRELAEELARGDETNSLGMDLVRIPEGRFMMGSDRREDEKPIHEVTIKNPFHMAQCPVSQGHWRQIMGNNPSTSESDDRPVHCVSWDDAQEFIGRLNALDNDFEYRLPSEAEWEYACRTGLSGRFDAGEYYMSVYGDAAYAAFPSSTRPPFDQRPVGKKLVNAFGLFDMLGGYKEWCADRYHVNYDGAPSDGTVWDEIAGEENRVPQMNRVARGAFSGSPSSYWRAAARSWAAPSSRGNIFSFRLVAVEK